MYQTHRTAKDIQDDVAARIPLREVKAGEFFRVVEFDKGAVYQRGHYCAGRYNGKPINRYSCTNQNNGNELLFAGDKLVFVGFTY